MSKKIEKILSMGILPRSPPTTFLEHGVYTYLTANYLQTNAISSAVSS